MSGWGCPYEVNGICDRVDGAYCRPGMKGCILHGKVEFHDGIIPSPVWPPGRSQDTSVSGDEEPPDSVEGPG